MSTRVVCSLDAGHGLSGQACQLVKRSWQWLIRVLCIPNKDKYDVSERQMINAAAMRIQCGKTKEQLFFS